MVVSTAKAPLVELTAELRWHGCSRDDGLIERFEEIAASKGIGRCEATLAPRGLAGSHPPVTEYRPRNPAVSSPLYRLGDGVFSITALPPYKSWSEFEPKVRGALDILERTFGDGDEGGPRFNGAMIRYVDAFGSLAGGEPTLAQFAEALGCRVELHGGLRSVCTDQRGIAPRISLTIPVVPGEMTIVLVEATIGNEKAVIMEKTVTIARDIGSNAASAMTALVEARGPIHDLFVDLMHNLGELMRPSMA